MTYAELVETPAQRLQPLGANQIKTSARQDKPDGSVEGHELEVRQLADEPLERGRAVVCLEDLRRPHDRSTVPTHCDTNGEGSGDGHTEVSEEDRQGLLPSHIATRAELYEAEQRNILDALSRRPPRLTELLDDKYLRDLHRSMFGQVWRWAGTYRTTETNIGIDPANIAGAVVDLVADARAWIDYETYPADEIAVRFHHRLVAVHPFANGNGRHGRVAGDYLIAELGGTPFTWGRGLSMSTEDLRTAYRTALHAADGGDLASLVAFARS